MYMQSFSEQRFPTDISYGVMGGPRFETSIITTNSGIEYRNVNFQTGRNRYNLASNIRTKPQLDAVIAFFRTMRGRGIGFRFKDWLDFAATNEQIAICDGKMRKFFLSKERRRIYKPVAGTVSVYLNAIKTTSISLDCTSGAMLFHKTPRAGSVISADFEFDVPVRFDTDHINASMDNYGVYSVADIPLIELKL